MSIRDELLAELYAVQDQLARAETLATATGVKPVALESIAAAREQIATAVDLVTRQAFDEGTPGRIAVGPTLTIMPKPKEEDTP